MGKEAECHCQWGKESGHCKVLLESHELIVRGLGRPGRRTVAINSLAQVHADGELLRFRSGNDEVALTLGASQAQSWAKKILTPPPTLAEKLGFGPATELELIGAVESGELQGAIAQCQSNASRQPNFILAAAYTPDDLRYLIERYPSYSSFPPIWIIYPKGPGKPLSEKLVIETLRSAGFKDTKVASVSSTLTALRFHLAAERQLNRPGITPTVDKSLPPFLP